MFRSTLDFEKSWGFERESTLKLLRNLTDASLRQRVATDHRTLGALAWHIVQTIPEMMNRTGLNVVGPTHDTATPPTAVALAEAYARVSDDLLDQVTGAWGDADLLSTDDMYGEKWQKGLTLRALIDHQIHHRGQMTVLMRQAGLSVPGIYGPSRDEWAGMQMAPPPND